MDNGIHKVHGHSSPKPHGKHGAALHSPSLIAHHRKLREDIQHTDMMFGHPLIIGGLVSQSHGEDEFNETAAQERAEQAGGSDHDADDGASAGAGPATTSGPPV